MGFTNYRGVNQLFHMARNANPTLPAALNESTCYFPKLTANGDQASALLAGRYGSGVRGYKWLNYTRLDLAKVFAGPIPKIPAETLADLHSLLYDLYYATGFAFDETDLEQVALPANQQFPWSVTLKASAGSFLFHGQTTVEFVHGNAKLFYLVANRTLDVSCQSFVETASRARAELYTFGIDYTTNQSKLVSVPTGSLTWSTAGSDVELRCSALASALNDIDRLPWKSQLGNNAFNLNGAQVVYNGLVSGYKPTGTDFRFPNPKYDRVMVVSFLTDNTTASGFYGSLMFIHYNTDTDNVNS